jgi:hypothetical protein
MIKCYQNFVNIPSKLYLEFKNYIQNLKIIFKTQKCHYIQNFQNMSNLAITIQNRFILTITKQGYNHLFHWDLTLLSPSNGIGVVVCFVLKKQV